MKVRSNLTRKEQIMKNKLATLFAVATVAVATLPAPAVAGAGDVVVGLIGGAIIGAAVTANSAPTQVHYVSHSRPVVITHGCHRPPPPPRHFRKPPPPRHFRHHQSHGPRHVKGRHGRRR